MSDFKKLKQLVLQSKNLSEPFNYFFDMVENKVIQATKERTTALLNEHKELPLILAMLSKEVSQILGMEIQDLKPRFLEIAEHHFMHGTCLCSEIFAPITLIYFSDVQTGILAIGAEKVHLIRFSLAAKTASDPTH